MKFAKCRPIAAAGYRPRRTITEGPVTSTSNAPPRSLIGIAGLDQVLGGGLPSGHLYLIDGEPGSGKTTLALQFLLSGRDLGEPVLYVTLSETPAELRGVAQSHGWSLDGVELFELGTEVEDSPEETYTLFHPAEVELQRTLGSLFASVEAHNPKRVVIDSLSELRLLARESLRFRRQILALKHFFAKRDCTVVLIDDKSSPHGDLQLQSIAHGVILLEHLSLEYGAERRRLQVRKLRGVPYRGGYHDFRICTGGIVVYPRILRIKPPAGVDGRLVMSGSPELDKLLGGGLARGTSTLLTGAAGTGKSIIATQYARAAAARGERVMLYMFDERITTFHMRAKALGIDLERELASLHLTIKQVEPTDFSPGEFAADVVRAVDEEHVDLVILDSINGYMQSMPEERLLGVQLHELMSYLANRGVSSIMTLVQRGVFGGPVDESADVSYLADTVILLRYFEFQGSVRQAMSVVKKRSGEHERTIREFRVQAGGILVGDPLVEFQGVLTGVPEYNGSQSPLMHERSAVPS
jgi:circadian clock protein KaiC